MNLDKILPILSVLGVVGALFYNSLNARRNKKQDDAAVVAEMSVMKTQMESVIEMLSEMKRDASAERKNVQDLWTEQQKSIQALYIKNAQQDEQIKTLFEAAKAPKVKGSAKQ